MPWYGLDEGARALIPHSQLYYATPLNNVQANNQMCKCKENSKCGSRLTAVQNVLWQDINLHAIATRHSDVGCDYLSFDFFRDKFYNYCFFFSFFLTRVTAVGRALLGEGCNSSLSTLRTVRRSRDVICKRPHITDSKLIM